MHRKPKVSVGFPVRNQLGICRSRRCFQLCQNIAVAFSCENERPPTLLELCRLVIESRQFIDQGQPANTRADVMHSAD